MLILNSDDNVANDGRHDGNSLSHVISLVRAEEEAGLTPIVMSLEVANAQYKRNPMKDVYKPYSGVSLARLAYAMP